MASFYQFSINVGSKYKEYFIDGKEPPLSLKYPIGYVISWFKKYKKTLGLNNCRYALSGAAPISPDLINWYLSLGIDMREGWGMTETAGVGTAFYSREIKLGHVGRAVNDSEVRIAQDGEILFRGPGCFVVI